MDSVKIIFLDFDGVLNSRRFDASRDFAKCEFIDETRLNLLKMIVSATDAKIVLTTTWKHHWDANLANCSPDGIYIDTIFNRAGLEIYGKTPNINTKDRKLEIASWLQNCNTPVKSFVILDDENFGWDDFYDNWIKTNYAIGYGLEQNHVEKAIKILQS